MVLLKLITSFNALDDQESTSLGASYTMGSMTLSGVHAIHMIMH